MIISGQCTVSFDSLCSGPRAGPASTKKKKTPEASVIKLPWEFTVLPTYFRVNILQYITAIFKFATMGQCYKTFYHNLLPFHSNYQGNVASQNDSITIEWR
jgi:hypothetical protein